MPRPSGMNIEDLLDNSHQTNMNVLSAEEHGDPRTVRKNRQVARFSEPEPRYYTTHMQGGDEPASSSKYPTFESQPTLVVKDDPGWSEKRRGGSQDAKNSTKQRGRPRLSTADSTRAEKRRTQLRVAQRTFKLRQENKIQSLESKVLNMEKVISQTSNAFLDFQKKVLASGVLNQAPELSHSLQSTVNSLSLAKAIAIEQDSDRDDFEDESSQERTSGGMSGGVEDHVGSVDYGSIASQRRPIASESTAGDRTAHDLIGENARYVHRHQKLPGNAVHSGAPPAIHQSRPDHYLSHAAERGAAVASSPLRAEHETVLDSTEDLSPEDPWADIVDATEVNSNLPRLPAKRRSEVHARTTYVRGRKKSPLQKSTDRKRRDEEVHRSLQEMRYSSSPSSGRRMPDTPMHEIFLESFLDTYAVARSDWYRHAAKAKLSSPILYNSFLFVSASYFGSSVGDSRIVFGAQKVYVNVLRELQRALLSPSSSKSQWTLFTVILAVQYEMLQNTSEHGMVNHMRGALKLIEFRGPQRHVYGLEHLCFVQYRNYLISTATACRTPTFLAREEWKTLPWSANSSEKDLVQHLLDHLADIPGLLAQYDSLMAATRANSLPLSEILDRRAMFELSVADIQHRLYKWKREYADPAGQPFEVPNQVEDLGGPDDPSNRDFRFPIFRCRDMSSGTLISPPPIAYPDPELARALCLYYAALLTVSFVDIRKEGGLLPHERYDLACVICRSTAYTLQAVPNHSHRVLGSLRVAYDTLPEGGIERQWVVNMFHVIGKAEQVKATAQLAKPFSVLANASQ